MKNKQSNTVDKVSSEDALRKSIKDASDYKYALEESCIVAITDQKGIINYANDNFCRISKYSREELIGQDHRIINSGYHPKEVIRKLWTTIAGGKIWRGELKNKAKDGTHYWVDTTIVPFLNEEGKPYQYVAIKADITERKKLEEQQELFASIVNSSDDAIISKTLEGIITSWNQGAERIFGYTPAEAIGKHISILIPPTFQKEEEEIIAKIRKGKSVDHYETIRVRKDGKLIYVSLTVSPVKDRLGNIIGASKILCDITEHKKVQQKLAASEQQFRHTLDSMMEGAQILDFDWQYIYVNDALEKHSTYSKEELLGHTMMEKYPGMEQTDLFKTLKRCMNERVSEHLETEFVFPNGTKADFELSIQPIPEGIFILSIDITEQKKARERLLKANRLYAFISAVNQSIVHINNKQELLDKACAIAIDIGAFKSAWIGLVDEKGTLNIVSSDGDPAMIKEVQKYSGKDFSDPALKDSTNIGVALSTGQKVVRNDVLSDPSLKLYKDIFIQHNVKSTILFPIKNFGKTIGAFAFHSTTENFFDETEMTLLEEAADDISFALENFEKEKRQKETESKASNSEKRFQALIEKSTDMITVAALDGKVTYGSPSITSMFGYTLEEFSNKSVFDFIHQEDIAGFIESVKEIVESPGKSFYRQQRLMHKKGHWVWCEGNVTNLLNEPGINGLLSNFRDISERKMAEERQQFDKSNLSALINNTADLMWSVDKDFNLITTNQPFDEMSKVNFGRVIPKGESVLSVSYTPEMQKHFKGLYERAFAGETFTETEYFDFPVEQWTEISYFPIYKENEVIGTACHSRDITERKKSEEKLKQSETRLKEAQALANTGNFEIDLVKNVQTWSDELYNLLGLKKGEVQPSPEAFLSFMHPDDADFSQKKVMDSFDTSKDTSFNYRFIRKDGTTRYGYTEARFEFDRNNKPVRLYGIVQDITEGKAAEEKLEKQNRELLKTNTELDRFVYSTSHDLRAPLASLLGLIELIHEDAAPGNNLQEERLGMMKQSVLKLDDFIGEILDYSRNARSELAKEDIDFKKAVQEVRENLKFMEGTHGLKLKIEIEEKEKFVSDKRRVNVILSNLISNSIKYRDLLKKDSFIDVYIQTSKEKVTIIVEDNGIGIADKDKEKIFEMFYRGSKQSSGSGLGLYIVKETIEKLGATITVDSEKSVGSKFTVTIPNLI